MSHKHAAATYSILKISFKGIFYCTNSHVSFLWIVILDLPRSKLQLAADDPNKNFHIITASHCMQCCIVADDVDDRSTEWTEKADGMRAQQPNFSSRRVHSCSFWCEVLYCIGGKRGGQWIERRVYHDGFSSEFDAKITSIGLTSLHYYLYIVYIFDSLSSFTLHPRLHLLTALRPLLKANYIIW